MNSFNNAKIYVADFETTVFSEQDFTEVWAAAIVELGHAKVEIFNSIDLFFEYKKAVERNSFLCIAISGRNSRSRKISRSFSRFGRNGGRNRG